jgi:hypothetical protein
VEEGGGRRREEGRDELGVVPGRDGEVVSGEVGEGGVGDGELDKGVRSVVGGREERKGRKRKGEDLPEFS